MNGTPSPEDLTAFKKLFWEARKGHRETKKAASADDPAHEVALEFAREHGWEIWAEPVLEAMRLAYAGRSAEALATIRHVDVPNDFGSERFFLEGAAHHGLKDYVSAIESYRKALDSPDFGSAAQVWTNMGNAYSEKKDLDAAIDCYRKAIDTSSSDSSSQAWKNMGDAFAEKKDLDTAIECYRTAITCSSFNTAGPAWNSMGIAYGEKKDFDLAINCFHKALDSGHEAPGIPWNNIGNAHWNKEDFSSAVVCYRKAIESLGDKPIHRIRLNLSLSLRALGRLDEAEQEIRLVLSESDTEEQRSRAELLLSLLEAQRSEIELKPEDEALTVPTLASLQEGPEDQMKKLLLDQKSQYAKYLERAVYEHPDDLTILRGWSSSVTLLEGGGPDRQWSGGGYFLKWRGKGIVIDPGFDFLDNFHEAEFHAKEIHGVLVSHNHRDHNGDLGAIDDLCYEVHRQASGKLRKMFFAIDEDTALRNLCEQANHRGWASRFSLADCDDERWHNRMSDLGMTIEHFPVEHGSEVPNAMGLRLRLHLEDVENDFLIGYTGDGRFTNSLVENLEGCDLIIAHVSQPDVREFNDPDFLKEVHLGYNGVIKLLKNLKAKPKITLVGEFWAGLADLRLPLITGIRQRSGVDAVFPACLGLSLRLPDLTIRCTHCKAQVPFSRIKITPPLKEFGLLGYLCDGCIF
jgi:tetratricopeptide (TPR) repeat protein